MIQGTIPLFELRAVGGPELRDAVDEWRAAEKAGAFAFDELLDKWQHASSNEARQALVDTAMAPAGPRGTAHGKLLRACEAYIYGQDADELSRSE